MKNITVFALSYTLLFHLSQGTVAEEIGWHDQLTFIPGRGVEPRNPQRLHPAVAQMDVNGFDSSGGGESFISASFSQHQFDLVSRLNLNASYSVQSYLGGNGSFHMSFLDDRRYAQNTLNFVWEGTRKFGGKTFRIQALDLDFLARVNNLKQTLRGELLHNQIVQEYGSDFVTGWKKEAKVIVVYQFALTSSAVTRSLELSYDASYGGGPSSVDLNTSIKALFQRNDTTVTLNYSFYSSSTNIPTAFPLVGKIENYDAFLAFSERVQDYFAHITEADAKPTAYVIEPIQNLPGYRNLVDVFSPANLDNADYNRFLKAYANLRRWSDLLDEMAIDERRMSWLNAVGKQQVLAIRKDVANYLRSLEEMARQHFETGATLHVPDEVFNYFVNFNRIPLPSISLMRNIPYFSAIGHFFIGKINCGPKLLVTETPFRAISGSRSDGAQLPLPSSWASDIYYSAQEFTNWLGGVLSAPAVDPDQRAAYYAFLNSPQWGSAVQDAARCRVGFFVVDLYSQDLSKWSVSVRDAADGTVESTTVLSNNDAPCLDILEAAAEAEVAITVLSQPTVGAVDTKSSYEYVIINHGPGAAYGLKLSVPIPANLEVLSVTGSHGYSIVTNGQALFEVGPLSYGSVATAKLSLVPQRPGIIYGSPAHVTVGEGLTDSQPQNDTAIPAPLTVNKPSLSIAQTTSYVELSWVSETGRLTLQSAPRLSASPTWESVTDSPSTQLSRRTVRIPITDTGRFFQLQGRGPVLK